jgi:hypothetical protein
MFINWRVPTAEVRSYSLVLLRLWANVVTSNSPHIARIHILDDDSLLNIFHLYRPPIFDGDESDEVRASGGRKWDLERWWHKLAQVCQRWRKLLLGSASYLGLCLVCTWGTPVADMLAGSPSLPLVIDYDNDDRYITVEEQESITLALKQRDRVRRVRLQMTLPIMLTFVMVINKEYPTLEYLILKSLGEYSTLAPVLPKTLELPRLRHLLLMGVVPPIGSRLLTTAVGLVTLCLYMQKPTTYFQPNILLQCLSFMPQLEILLITKTFFHIPDDMERQLLDTPITTRVTLPNLRLFQFEGSSTYMEVVVHQITAPSLEKLNIRLYDESTLSVPHLLRFMNTAENLRFDSAAFEFSLYRVSVKLYRREEAEVYALSMTAFHLAQARDMQLSSVAKIFNSLGQKISKVEHLCLNHTAFTYNHAHDEPEVDPTTEWRELLRLFRYVKTLDVHDHLVKEVSRCLELDGGGHSLEILPELQELTYSGSDDTSDAFISFIHARRDAGRPVALIALSHASSPLAGFLNLLMW